MNVKHITFKHELVTRAHRVGFPVRQFLTLTVPVAVLIFFIAVAFTDVRIEKQLEQITASERAHLHHVAGFMAAETSIALHHLLSLAQEKALIQVMDAPTPHGLQSLQSVFMTFTKRNFNYQQVRWIDETGAERVRITRDHGRLFLVDANGLQDKSKRYYFKAARKLAPGEVYISRLDLNKEHGKIEKPIRPTLRVATPIEDSQGNQRGILIINIAMRYMLDAIRVAREQSVDTEYFLVNKSGYWLTTSKKQDPVDFQTEASEKFSAQYPDAWKHISASDTGTIESHDGFWIWEKLSLADAIRQKSFSGSSNGIRISHIDAGALSLKLVAHRSIQTVIQLRQDIRLPIALGAILVLVGYTWGTLFFLRGMMKEKQAELNVTDALARASQMERLKELEERFRLLVEASSVGLVLVDAEGIIVMANPAAASMLGYERAALEGLNVDSLLPASQRDQHTQLRQAYLRDPKVRKMGQGRRLEALTADGRRIPVEISLNPFLDHGKQVVLASIVDLSQ